MSVWARADYDFGSQEAGDLRLEVGDVVRLTGAVDGAWLRGRRLDAQGESPEGLFPKDFVSELGLPDQGPDETVLVALSDFPGQAAGDLSLEKGRLVLGRRRLDDNWWEGLLVDSHGRATAQHGIFPANFVRVLPVSAAASTTTARLLQTLTPQLDEEMAAQEGEVVRILRQIDKMWVQAESLDGSRRGNIPRGFLAIDLDQPAAPTPDCSVESEPVTPIAPQPMELPSLASSSGPPDCPPPQLPTAELDISTAAETEPYAITKHAFRAVDGTELSFEAGEIVLLLAHPDEEWSEGELAGRRGLFPTAFVDIIVDCEPPPASPSPQPLGAVPSSAGPAQDSGYASASEVGVLEQRMVLYDFPGSEEGDLHCRAGDVVRLLRHVNADWVEAAHSLTREVGLIPASFLDQEPQPSAAAASPGLGMQRPKSSPSLDAIMFGKTGGDDSGHSSSHSNTPSVISGTSRASGDLFFTPPSSPTPSPSQSQSRMAQPAKPPRPKASPALKQLHAKEAENREATRAQEAQNLKQKAKEQRAKVAEELVASEDAFTKDTERTISSLEAAARVGSVPLDSRALLSGFPQVAALSKDLHRGLREELAKGAEAGSFGKVFLEKMESFRKVYEWFWETSEESVELLHEYEAEPPKAAVLRDWLERMRASGTVCLDPTAALTRPLQRVLKYPLFISQLLKASPQGHPDRKSLSEALEAMTALAQAINEAKRRKDLVLKYRAEERSLGTRLAHISLHSFLKKSSRLAGRLKSGFVEQERDEAYEAAERHYRNVSKAVRHFLKDLALYTDQLQHASMHHASLLQSWRDVAGGPAANLPDSFKLYQDATRRVVQILLPAYFEGLRSRVREPLSALAAAFPGPDKLIAKRKDKLLDYRAAVGKVEQRPRGEGGASRQTQLAQEHETRARAEYMALHSQLLSELPRLAASAQDILRTALHSLAAQQRSFQQQLRQAYQSLDGYAEPLASLLTKFDAKHRRALETLAAASNAPRHRPPPPASQPQTQPAPAAVSLRRKSSESKKKDSTGSMASIRNSVRFKPLMKTSGSGKVAFPKRSQTEADRDSLRAKAVAGGLYVVRQAYAPGPDAAMDLAVSPGDLVIPLIRKDPMGTTQRWYVDSGIGKGFIPAPILALVDSHRGPDRRAPLPPQGPQKPQPPQRSASMAGPHSQRPASLISFDDSPQQRTSVASSHILDLEGLDLYAPPPLQPPEAAKPLPAMPSLSQAKPIDWGPPPQPRLPAPQPPPSQALAKRSAPGPPPPPAHRMSLPQLASPPRAQATPLRSPVPPPPAQTASPAVPSASRPLYSNVGFEAASPRQPVRAAPPPPKAPSEEPEPVAEEAEPEGGVEFFVSEFGYEGSEEGELGLAEGQVVAVHKRCDVEGNDEWWLVEDEWGALGYVPSNYLSPHVA